MSYSAAITWLNEHGIKHEKEDADGNAVKDEAGNPIMVEHAVGDDIAEAAERQMMDLIGAPIFLYGFPAKLKDFYMKKMPADKQEGDHIFTESCDLLMPGVGEVVGGSMRIPDEEELLAVYKREGIDPGPCYWFTDQRKYGTCEHGGYGLGVEVDNWSLESRAHHLRLFSFLAIPGVVCQQIYSKGMFAVSKVAGESQPLKLEGLSINYTFHFPLSIAYRGVPNRLFLIPWTFHWTR